MKAIDFQTNKVEQSNIKDNSEQKLFHIEQEKNIKFNIGNKTFYYCQNEEKLIKNKRNRDPQNLDIAKHTIIRNINVISITYI
jgi:hypothetical protein